MRKIYVLLLGLLFSLSGYSQDYLMSLGNNGQTITTCTGNFYDSGGPGGAYGNNENRTITFCPTSPGQLINIAFSTFNVQGSSTLCQDYLDYWFAPTPGADGTGTRLCANLGAFNLTSTSIDGCISFRFVSNDDGVTRAGWAGVISCSTAPACAQPTGLNVTGITATGANVSWTQPNGAAAATQWQIFVGPQGGPAPINNPTATPVSNPHTLTGLTGLTQYCVYVRAICTNGDGFSEWTGPQCFTTGVPPLGCNGIFTDSGGVNGNYGPNENIITTICPETPGQIVEVTFTQFQTEVNWDRLYIYNGSTIAAPLIASPNPGGSGPCNTVAGGWWGNQLQGQTVTSTSPDGCLTFRFCSDGSVQQAGWVANVACIQGPACPNPTNVTVNNIQPTSAQVNWTQTGTPTSWEVTVVPVGSPAPSNGAAVVPANVYNAPGAPPVIITGLTDNTNYIAYVRAICGPNQPADGTSFWSASAPFLTPITPPACGGIFTDSGGPNGNYGPNENIVTTICPQVPGQIVEITFTQFQTEVGWDRLYIYNGNSIAAPLFASPNPGGSGPCNTVAGGWWGNQLQGQTVFSTSPDGCLTFRFCSDGSVQQAGWVANIACVPGPACANPSNLVFSNITTNSAIGSWSYTGTPTPTQWEVSLLPQGTPNPSNGAPINPANIFNNPPSPPVNFTGLNPEATYNMCVRAICADGAGTSFWVCNNFTTLAPPINLVRINKVQNNAGDTDFDPEAYFSPAQMVSQVLIPEGGDCFNVNNVIIEPSTQQNINNSVFFAQNNRTWGYFEKGQSNFPFDRGIVLSTGIARNGGNIFNINALGDTYAQTANYAAFSQTLANATGIPTNTITNLTGLEFGFTAFGNMVSFEYILASEEYTTTFPCTFTDAFALLVRNAASDPNNPASWTNLAVLPNGGGPVNVTNIRPAGLSCPAANPEFFAGYNPGSSNFVGPNWAATSNYNGQTVPLTAQFNSVPGQNYVFRFLIADFQDTAFDSAVFIKGDFNMNLQLGNGNNPYPEQGGIFFAESCSPDDLVLNIVNALPEWIYQNWTYSPDNTTYTPIPGTAGQASITVNQFGFYQVAFNCTNNPNATPIILTFHYSNNSNIPAPTVEVTQPTCLNPTGTIVVTSPLGNQYEYSVNGVDYFASPIFNNLNPGTYQVTVNDIVLNCLSDVLEVIILQPTDAPDVPLVSVINGTCLAAGSATISNYNSNLNYTSTPSGLSIGINGIITDFFCGVNYTITATNNEDCSATSLSFTIGCQLSTPEVPLVSITPATCNAAGSAVITNVEAGVTYTFVPAGPTVDALGNISNFNCGTAYTVTAVIGDCSSAPSTAFTIDCQLLLPINPIVTTTPATCSAAGGATISNFDANITYIFNPTGPSVDSTGNILGLTCGINYSVTASNGSCSSAAVPFGVACQLPTPDVPLVSTTPATCNAAGMASFTNFDVAVTYTFDPSGPTVDATGNISGLTCGQAYTVTATLGTCISAPSAAFTIGCQLLTPVNPIVSTTPATCSGAGTATISNFVVGNTYIFNPTGPTVGANGIITGLSCGTITYTVTANNGSCSSSAIQFSVACQLPSTETPTIVYTAADCFNQEAATISNYNQALSYTFTPSSGSSTPSIGANGVISGLDCNVSYTLVASNGQCPSAAVTIDVECIVTNACQIPRGISPNGDGLNDVWDIEFLNAKRVEIFNRYGMIVYSRDNYRKEWGGLSNDGQQLSDGTYFYVITLENENKSGWVYINRERR